MVIGPKTTVKIQRISSSSKSSMGTFSMTWADLIGTVSGVLMETDGKEQLVNERETVVVTHNFFCAASALAQYTLTEKDRLVYNSSNYDIVRVTKPAEKNRMVVLKLRIAK